MPPLFTKAITRLKPSIAKRHQPTFVHTTASPSRRQHVHQRAKMPTPHLTSTTPLPPNTAKWIEFLHLTYTDSRGVPRTWEACGRKTRGASGIDAVAIFALLKSSRGKEPSTILVLQYRPPVDAICVEFPAGLIDKDESPEVAALRELMEETGFEGKVIGCSPTVVSNPGMSTGNMRVVTVEVDVEGEGEVEMPEQKLEEGEDIEVVIVPLGELYKRLVKYSEEGKKVDSRLWHTAMGLELASQLK